MGRTRKPRARETTPITKTYWFRNAKSGKKSDQVTTDPQRGEKMASTSASEKAANHSDADQCEKVHEDEEVSTMESRILRAIGKLDRKTDELKTDMNARLEKIEETLTKNSSKIGDLEKSVEFGHKPTNELSDKVHKLEAENKDLKKKSVDEMKKGEATKSIVHKLEEEMREKMNDMERHSRSYSIRVKGVQGVPDREDFKVTVDKVLLSENLITGDDVTEVVKLIEHAHPLSRRDDNGKINIIARLYSRPIRNGIVEKAKKKRYPRDSLKVVEDMTKTDFLARKKAYPQMQRAYQQGKKAKFVRGKLIIDGREVAIDDQ